MKNSRSVAEDRKIRKNKSRMIKFMMISVIAALLFCVVFYRFMTAEMQDKGYQNLKNAIYGQSAAVSDSLSKYTDEISISARHISIVVGGSSDNDVYIEHTREIVNDAAEMIFFADLNGTAYLCGGNAEGIESEDTQVFDFSNSSFFNKAMQGEVYLGNPFATEKCDDLVIAVSAPVTNLKKEIVGALICFYSVDVVNQSLKAQNTVNGYISYIITKENSIVAKTDNLDFGVGIGEVLPIEDTAYASVREFNEMNEKQNFGYGEIGYNNVRYIAAFKNIDKSDWNLVVAMPQNMIMHGFNTLIYGVILSACLAEVIILYLIRSSFANLKKYDNLISYSNKYRDMSPLIYITLRRDGLIVSANQRFSKETGYSAYELEHTNIYDIVPENYSNDLRAYIYKCSTGNDVGEIEVPIRAKTRIVHYHCFTRKYELLGVNNLLLIAMNVERYKEYEEKMNRIVYYDSLTGLKNGVWLENHFNELMEDEKTKNQSIAVIYIDIDNFKYINDMFGHDLGDKIIVELCRRLQKINNKNATICRRGGDELCIIVEDAHDKIDLDYYLTSVSSQIGKDFFVNGAKHSVTASIGVAVYPDDGITYNELFTSADIAMNNAKENGKNSIVYFKKEMQESMCEIITMESDLKNAIINNEFVLYYQPQYNIETGKLYGFEALIRWLNPKRGFVNPGKFISHAERTQMIIPIGDWILNEACGFANEAVEMGRDDICISVNVSVIQMLCADYTERTLDIVKRNKTNPKNIKLEITESVFMDTIDDMIMKIKELNKNGLYFALDDFGTGYSSLNYLKKIPIKVLKIDKSFVDMIIDENGNKDIISSIINLAHDMNLQVVAEGIEDKVQLAWLRKRGCNIAQGFYTGRPMPREEALKELHKNIYSGEETIAAEFEMSREQNYIQLS